MTRNAIPTYVTGQVLTAAHLNTYLRDNEAEHWAQILALQTNWQAWTPTFTRWSSQTTTAVYARTGNLVLFNIYQSAGTSNDTVAKISLPITAAGGEGKGGVCAYVIDGGNVLSTACRWWISGAASEIEFFTNMANGAWTNSGTKRIAVQGFYRV